MSRPENFHEVWLAIIKSIDQAVKIVRPQRTLMLSLDGVCPRAKVHD
jgi:5'-3' exonuclease